MQLFYQKNVHLTWLHGTLNVSEDKIQLSIIQIKLAIFLFFVCLCKTLFKTEIATLEFYCSRASLR